MVEKTYLDVNVLIYWLTKHPEFGAYAYEWVKKVEETKSIFLTSALSIYETTVLLAGLHGTNLKNQTLVGEITESINDLTNLQIVPFTVKQAIEAPLLMSLYNLDFEDSLHLAAAMEYDATIIVSNNRDFDRTPLTRVF